MRLQGKTVVITGASSGIGKATAARCLDEGARIVAVSDRPGGEQVAVLVRLPLPAAWTRERGSLRFLTGQVN